MKKLSLFKSGSLLVIGSILLTGCVVRETRYRGPRAVVVAQPAAGEVVVNAAPPAPIVETVTVSPGPDFVWIPGAWAWEGRWMWERGHWANRPHVGAVWVPHRYVYRNGAYVFIRGGWR